MVTLLPHVLKSLWPEFTSNAVPIWFTLGKVFFFYRLFSNPDCQDLKTEGAVFQLQIYRKPLQYFINVDKRNIAK